jgi:hypothetical protein
LAFPEPNLKLSDAQPFFCFKIPNPNLDKRAAKCKTVLTTKPLESMLPIGRVGWPRGDTVRDVVVKYPIWQEPYRAAVTETNPKLLKHKISNAQQAAILRLKQLENSADHHHELIALTDALTALKILGETIWAE